MPTQQMVVGNVQRKCAQITSARAHTITNLNQTTLKCTALCATADVLKLRLKLNWN